MSPREVQVVSVLLSDPPPVLVAPAHPVDPDFAESLASGLTESLDAWDARIGGGR